MSLGDIIGPCVHFILKIKEISKMADSYEKSNSTSSTDPSSSRFSEISKEFKGFVEKTINGDSSSLESTYPVYPNIPSSAAPSSPKPSVKESVKAEFLVQDGILTKYVGNKTGVTIPLSVRGIGDGAFESCREILSINIPEGVTSIGECAFKDCESLGFINLPHSLISIGKGAFYNCKSLKEISIPEGVTSIEESTFLGCYELESIVLPKTLEKLDELAFGNPEFHDKLKLKHAEVPIAALQALPTRKLITLIINGGSTLDNDSAGLLGLYRLKSLTIPASVTNIHASVFYSFENLESLSIDEKNPAYTLIDGGIYTKDRKTFVRCIDRKSSSFCVPSGVTSIGDYAFYNLLNLNSITLPDGIVSIGELAFGDNYDLENVNLPYSLRSIGIGAFLHCMAFTEVTVPEGVTDIPNATFNGCKRLVSITLPESVNRIGRCAFMKCESLQRADLKGGGTWIVGKKSFAIKKAEKTAKYLKKTSQKFEWILK